MRAAILLLVLAACAASHDGDPCTLDADCGDEVCARTNVCAAAATLRNVHVTWTVNGGAPTPSSCTAFDPLEIDFEGTAPGVAFAPVPCMAGLYSIDKLPTVLDQVFLGPQNGSFAAQALIGTDGTAKLDLR